jgi:hypothetical protein
LPRIKLDRRIGNPPVLWRVLSQYQELIGLELGDAAVLHPIVAQIPVVDFLAHMQALAQPGCVWDSAAGDRWRFAAAADQGRTPAARNASAHASPILYASRQC